MTATQNKTAKAGTGTPGTFLQPADSADTTHAETDSQSPVPRKLVGQQAGFMLTLTLGIAVASFVGISIADAMKTSEITTSAWAQAIAELPIAALLFLWAQSLRKRDNAVTSDSAELHLHLRSSRRMTVPVLVVLILTLLFAITLVSSGFSQAIRWFEDAAHLTSETSQSEIGATSGSVIGILSACLIGPISEELLFRGVIMENLRRYGPVFAIVTSAILFGFMHGDVGQSFSACLAGLLFGYVAYRYSLTWSVGLHMLNNIVFMVEGWLPGHVAGTVNEALGVVALAVLLIAAVLKHTDIKMAFQTHPSPKGIWRAWLSPLFLFTLAFCVMVMVSRFSIS